jgi:hypothetical protein
MYQRQRLKMSTDIREFPREIDFNGYFLNAICNLQHAICGK